MLPKTYYSRLFPYPLIERLMEPPHLYEGQYPDEYRRARRELAFGFLKQPTPSQGSQATPNHVRAASSKQPRGDGLLRYQAFGRTEDGKELSDQFREHMASHWNTTRIDIGPVYSLPPQVARHVPASVEYRELIFDIDIFPDYNPFRMCLCAAAKPGEPPFLCPDCWPFLCAAMFALDFFLQRQLGYHECMWLFSGRRGVHCWVLDPAAGLLDAAGRKAIAEMIRSLSRCERVGQMPSDWIQFQPQIEKLYSRQLRPRFDAMIERNLINLTYQNTLGMIASIFSSVPAADREVKVVLSQLDRNPIRSSHCWHQILELAARFGVGHRIADIVFYVLFPKIDFNVSPSPVHLLRCPMSVHISTQNVAVPLLLSEIDSLLPSHLPNLERSFSMDKFSEHWVHRLDIYLWSRHPFASHLVCMHCAHRLQGVLALTREMTFEHNVQEWKAHIRQAHPNRSEMSPQQSTIRELIHSKCRVAGLTDWKRKHELFTKLVDLVG